MVEVGPVLCYVAASAYGDVLKYRIEHAPEAQDITQREYERIKDKPILSVRSCGRPLADAPPGVYIGNIAHANTLIQTEDGFYFAGLTVPGKGPAYIELFKTPASFDPNVPHGHRRFDMKHRGRMHTWTCESKGRKVPKCYTVQDAKNFLDNRTKKPYHLGTWNCHHAQEALLRDMGVEVPPSPLITRFTAKIATYLPDSLARDQPLPDDLFSTSASLDQNLIRRLFMDETTYFPLDRAMVSPQYFDKCPQNLDEIAAGVALSYPPVFGPHRSIPSTAKTTSPLLPTASTSKTHIPEPSPPNAETKGPNPFTESYSNSYTTSSSFTKPGRSSKTQFSVQEDGKGGVLATAMLGIGAVGLGGSTAGSTLVNGLVITGVKVGIAASASGSPMVTVGVVLSATNPVGLAWMGGIFAVSVGTMVAGAILSGRKRERRGK